MNQKGGLKGWVGSGETSLSGHTTITISVYKYVPRDLEEVMLGFPISYEYFEYFIVSVFICLTNNACLYPTSHQLTNVSAWSIHLKAS